jgi:RHS repeat-associated protein
VGIQLGNLAAATYADGKVDLRMPDAVGNLFRTPDRTDRKYGPAGQLLESRDARGVTTYDYDAEGNLTKKTEPDGAVWVYEWNGAGMLARVVRPNAHVVEFGYDPLARRTFKKYRGKTTKWIWDGNVPLHEWVERDADAVDEDFTRKPQEDDVVAAGEKALKAMLAERPANGPPVDAASAKSLEAASACGTVDKPVTWVFEPESFAPLAKIVGGERFGIVTDHLGTPRAMFDGDGREVWGADVDAYGDLRNLRGERAACPFRWPGQYEDEETGLYYNRFRYYAPASQQYVSQDPIGLIGGFALHNYVSDPVSLTDVLGLHAPWAPHGAGENDVISKGVHFNAGDPARTELKVVTDSAGKMKFERVFSKDSDEAVKKAIAMAEERFAENPAWRESLIDSAGKVKRSLFENFGRLDKARDAKKVEKSMKEAARACK